MTIQANRVQSGNRLARFLHGVQQAGMSTSSDKIVVLIFMHTYLKDSSNELYEGLFDVAPLQYELQITNTLIDQFDHDTLNIVIIYASAVEFLKGVIMSLDIKDNLKVLPCLSFLKEDELLMIEDIARVVKYPRNKTLFEASDTVRFFYIIKSGSIKLHLKSAEGRELLVKVMRPGEYFCCAPQYSGDRHFVSAIAQEDAEIIQVPSGEFKEMLYSQLGSLGLNMITGLCGKINYLSNFIEDITFKDVEQRVLFTILRLSEEKSPEEEVTLNITHQDIASMVGTVRVVVSRIMSRLKKEGVIVSSSVKGFKINKTSLYAYLKIK
jgi:CRP/FNR family transcriptional regulator